MGAGGSTAISCSSLDVSNEHYKQPGRHNRLQQQLRQVQEQRKQKYNRKQPPTPNMKQSNSYFDLTTNHLLNQNQLDRLQTPKTPEQSWFDTNQSESYSLSNADIGVTRPIRVLPSQPVVSPVNLSGSKCKTNAGVAGRIQMQRQQQRAHELRKFSDSLPSLASIHPSQQMLNQTSSSSANKPNDQYQFYANRKQQKQRTCSQPNNQISAKQQLFQQSHRSNNQQQLNIHLVSRNDDSVYPCRQTSVAANIEHHDCFSNSNQQLIKRAISLSSLHNLHHHHLNHHKPMTHIEQANNHDRCKKQQLMGAKHNHVVGSSPTNRHSPESMNNYLSYDLQQQPCLKHHNDNGYHNHFLNDNHQVKPKAQQQQQYNQPTPLAKKILKLKHFANGSGQSSKKYRKHQQQQQQQQGCPVLPPLPRSQSLHELIQLRATENGQRMRTTGTLRGPLGANGDQPCNKVNLVAELLENRRQQKMNEELGVDSTDLGPNEAHANQNLATMLSQTSSSSDDGIHDVSINGDQSTGDSRQHIFTNGNIGHKNHRLSLTSETSEQSKQRVFRKNSQLGLSNNQRRYSQNINQQHQHQQQNGRDLHKLNAPRGENCQRISGKSTLKRSVSHSALQANSNNLEDEQQDEDESDDLNELAKFLYQFKQRQAAASTSKGSPREEFNTSNNNNRIIHHGQSSNAIVSTGSNPQVANGSYQQSPNSTTSSSGFASSTCTSNSISSSASSKENRPKMNNNSTVKKAEQEQLVADQKSKKLPGRKKYPAPPRPDESTSNKLSEDCQTSGSNKNSGNSSKCLISGKLKLSSSLLSIVDEYNSTLQSSDSKIKHSAASPNITSVLLDKSASNQRRQTSAETSPDSGDELSGPSSNYSNDCHQLEELKRYTQLRQMSQSQLALNHLTSASPSAKTDMRNSSRSSSSGKDKLNNAISSNSSSSSKPYKSKLIDLIRRVSDKSEVANHKSMAVTKTSSKSSNSSKSNGSNSNNNSSVGGHFASKNKMGLSQEGKQGVSHLKTINQSESTASYSKQANAGRQEKYGLKIRDDGLETRKKAASSSGLTTSGVGSCLSESLCDLNFDCDFELIKNCGSANEPKGLIVRQQQQLAQTPPQATKQQQEEAQCNLILPSQVVALQSLTPSAAANPDDCQARPRQRELAKKHHQKQQPSQLAINSSKGENNWRLGPSSLSLTKPVVQVASSAGKANNKNSASGKQLYQSLEEGNTKGVCKLHSATTANMDKLAGQQKQQERKQPVKLKWSASGWLMNGSGSKTKKQASEKALSGKNCMPKSISNSRIPSLPVVESKSSNSKNRNQEAKATAVGPVFDENTSSAELGNFANVNNEANQLLYELDHSLDLVSANCAPFSRKNALSWWNLDDQMNPEGGGELLSRVGTGLDLLSDSEVDFDDDNDDDGVYESLNRAMINATFDADTIMQQHEQHQKRHQEQQNSKNKINLNSELSIEPGSPSDSFTFSAPSSPVDKTQPTCGLADNAKQGLVSAQSKPNKENENPSQPKPLEQHRYPGFKQQQTSQRDIPLQKLGGNVREDKLEPKGLSQIRKFTSNSEHVISNLSTTSAVSVSQPSDSSGLSQATSSNGKHQAALVSKKVGCNLAGERIVSCTSNKQQGGCENGEQQRAEDAKMMVDERLGLVPIVASDVDDDADADAARCIHVLDNKQQQQRQQQQQHNHLSNTCCAVVGSMLDCAHKREIGTNIPTIDLVRQSEGVGRTLGDGLDNCNNNLDCRCCNPLDAGRSLMDIDNNSMGNHRKPVANQMPKKTTVIADCSVPCRLNGTTNGLVPKCQSSSQPDEKELPLLENYVDVGHRKRQQVADGVEKDRCNCKEITTTACCIQSCQNEPQTGVGVKKFQGLNEHKPIHLMMSNAEVAKTPTKSLSSDLQHATANATNPANGSFCSVQGQLDGPGQSTCACCQSQVVSTRQQQQQQQQSKVKKSSESEIKDADKNMNGHQQTIGQCGHSPLESALKDNLNGRNGIARNNGRQTATMMLEDNPPATELRAQNCDGGALDSSNKCSYFSPDHQNESDDKRFLVCPDLHVSGSKTYCRSKRTATTSLMDSATDGQGLADEHHQPASNKLITQQRASCHCCNSAAASSYEPANLRKDDKSDNIIINDQPAAIPSEASSSSQRLTPPPEPSKLQNLVILNSAKGVGYLEGRTNNCTSSYCNEVGKSFLPHPLLECSQSNKNLRNGVMQQAKSTCTSKLHHQQQQQRPFLTGNCCHRCSKDAICNQHEQAAAITSKCKKAACHYPSSKPSQTNHGEDVKCAQGCVSKDNPISKAGHKLENDDDDESYCEATTATSSGETSPDKTAVSAAVSVSTASDPSVAPATSCCLPACKLGHNDCRGNDNRRKAEISQQQQQQPPVESDGKLIKRFNAALSRFTAHPVYCMGPQQQQQDSNSSASHAAKLVVAPNGSQQKPVAPNKNPICRSNSELTSNNQGIKHNCKLAARQILSPSDGHSSHNHHHHHHHHRHQPQHFQQRDQHQQQLIQQNKDQLLFGKLRSSLLNRKQEVSTQLNKGTKLSSSQLNILSYCNDAHLVSPFIGGQLDINSASNSQLNADFDDNFILKRKTPNAGLKSRC